MTIHKFTLKEVFSPAWTKTKEYAWYLFCVFILSVAVMAIGRFTFILAPLIDYLVGISIVTISLVIASGHTPTFNDLFKSFKNYKITWHYILTTLLYILIVVIGLIFFILPGIYLAVRLHFYKFLIIEHENMGPIDTLKESMRMTSGLFWRLLGFIIVIALFNIVGVLLLGVGLIITIPVSVLAHAFLYKKLLHHNKEVKVDSV